MAAALARVPSSLFARKGQASSGIESAVPSILALLSEDDASLQVRHQRPPSAPTQARTSSPLSRPRASGVRAALPRARGVARAARSPPRHAPPPNRPPPSPAAPPRAPAQEHALRRLDALVDAHWPEVADSVAAIEALAEAGSSLAASVASKVYYHLEAYTEAVRLALAAGARFDVTVRSEYVETIVGAFARARVRGGAGFEPVSRTRAGPSRRSPRRLPPCVSSPLPPHPLSFSLCTCSLPSVLPQRAASTSTRRRG